MKELLQIAAITSFTLGAFAVFPPLIMICIGLALAKLADITNPK